MPKPFINHGSYYTSFFWKGKKFLRSLRCLDKRTAELAQKKVDVTIGRIKGGLLKVPEGVPIQDFVFDGVLSPQDKEEASQKRLLDLISEYSDRISPPAKAQSTCDLERLHLRHLKRFLKEKGKNPLLARVTPKLFYNYKLHRQGAVSVDTINMELRTFQTMFNLAQRFQYLDSNPLKEVKRDKSEVAVNRFMTKEEIDFAVSNGRLSSEEHRKLLRFRYLTMEEVEELLRVTKGTPCHLMLCLAALTGARKGEILQLEWGDVDLRKKKVFLRSRKGSQARKQTVRDVDIHPYLMKALRAHKKAHSEGRFVFCGENLEPIHKDRARRWLQAAVAETSFEGIGFHSLRHSFASNLAAAGVDDRVIDHFMGHQTVEMRRRYQHLFPSRKRESILKLMP